jgi:hypothetical protein
LGGLYPLGTPKIQGKPTQASLVRYRETPFRKLTSCCIAALLLRHRKNTNYNMEHMISIFGQLYEIMVKEGYISPSL